MYTLRYTTVMYTLRYTDVQRGVPLWYPDVQRGVPLWYPDGKRGIHPVYPDGKRGIHPVNMPGRVGYPFLVYAGYGRVSLPGICLPYTTLGIPSYLLYMDWCTLRTLSRRGARRGGPGLNSEINREDEAHRALPFS